MWKKLINKPVPTATPPAEEETDAILSKIDASVNRRDGRGRQSEQWQNANAGGVGSGVRYAGSDAGVYGRERAVSDILPSPTPSPIPGYASHPTSPYGSPIGSPVHVKHHQPQQIRQQQQKQQIMQENSQAAYERQLLRPMPLNVNKPVPKSPRASPVSPPATAETGPQMSQQAYYAPPSSQSQSHQPQQQLLQTQQPQAPRQQQQTARPASVAQAPKFPVYKPVKTPMTDVTVAESLASHLFNFGFLESNYSDVILHVLGKPYQLHRVVLCRFGFFKRLFMDSSLIEESHIEIEVNDRNVTVEGVDIVLASMYGLVCPATSVVDQDVLAINSENVLSVLAAAIFFEYKKLTDYCLEFITSFDLSPSQYRSIGSEKFPDVVDVPFPTPNASILRYIQFIDGYDYGIISEILEDALLNYLCFEGYRHLESLFVDLPLPWLERVLEADAFWCPSEFGRYQFAKNVILQRKLQNLKTTESESQPGQRTSEQVYSDIFRYAIIYTHMSFEQLNEVRADNFVAESILMKSLWHQTRLRQSVETVPETTVSLYPDPEAQEQSGNISVPVRVGVEFSGFKDIAEGERRYSTTFFYGGSWWSVFLQRFPVSVGEDGAEKPQKWGIFLRRSEGTEIMTIAKSSNNGDASSSSEQFNPDKIIDPVTGSEIEKSVSYYLDKRVNVRACFKLFNPSIKSYDPIFESRPNDFTETQSWGFRSRDQVVSDNDAKLLEKFEDADELVQIRMSIVLKYL